MKQKQRKRSRMTRYEKKLMQDLFIHITIVISIMLVSLCLVVSAWMQDESEKDVEEDYHLVTGTPSTGFESQESTETVHKEEKVQDEVATPSQEPEFPVFRYSKDWGQEDSYLLARIAMAEAESCDTYTKTLVILTVLNRVWDSRFPDTIEAVLYQKVADVAQFSPMVNGRWDRVEPNEDCWEAVRQVESAIYDYSEGCLYFESCTDTDNWHSRNLEFLFESDGIRFYR